MLVQLHQSEQRDSATERGSLPGVRRIALYGVVAVAALLILFGVALLGVARTPDDRKVDAQLATIRKQMAEKRRQTVAGIADRIVDSPMGRRAQEELLRSTDEESAGTAP